ncbi:hypothetical protein WR25_25331 [Diploscapter pachys]|uniref:Uncharacterized protein n=1 Tax=Diploscapter pachys TaxID=2018661 RepID=A0A2A2JH75_9BILA|nr:hypothetical protein WR25_25331 [Diploscapter pachys]
MSTDYHRSTSEKSDGARTMITDTEVGAEHEDQALLESPKEPQIEGERLLGAANEHQISAVLPSNDSLEADEVLN